MRNFKKFISMLLVCIMLLSTLPLNAFAQEPYDPNTSEQTIAANSPTQGIYNPNAGEQSIPLSDQEEPEIAAKSLVEDSYNPDAKEQLIAALSKEYGADKADAMFESMISMGIIDEKGNRLSYKIEMEGKLYTLDQMRDIVNAPDVDLDREVKVDDQAVSLAFIAKLIDFETYMQFVEENFLKNNIQITDEHVKMLSSLEHQLTTEGINLEPAAPAQAMYTAAAVAPVPVVNCSAVANAYNGQVSITYNITGGQYNSQATFSQEYLPGMLGTSKELGSITMTGTSPKYASFYLPDVKSERWNGSATLGYLRLKDLNGCLFSNGKSSQLIPITMSKTYDYTLYSSSAPNLFPGMAADGEIFLEKALERYYNPVAGPGRVLFH
ncbi:MAG: hypothetical protein U9N81_12905 [Bacillota bacterium]|nr:hypothetical protein [Bacillota bacterium]